MEAALDGIAAVRDTTRRILGATLGGGRSWWPGPHRLAAFVDACRRRSLPMRAAGDRMPLLGIVAAAALSHQRATPVAALERVLGERYPDRFILRGRHLVWSGVALDAGALRAMRRELLAGIAVESFPSAAAELAG